MSIAKVRHIIHTKQIYRKRAVASVLPIAALFLASTAFAGGSGHITNLSSRTYVGPGDSATITGFTISGAAQTVVVRAIGPTLAQFGIANWLVDPTLELHAATGAVIATNDNWADTQASLFRIGGAYAAFRPPSEMESAIAMTLQASAYTAVVRGKNGATGVALAEVYAASNDPSSSPANVSSRALVGIGENVLIGGLTVANDNADFVLRALGPSLAQFGIINPLSDPLLELYDSNGHLIRQDDNWADDPQQAAQIEAKGFIPPSRLDSVMAVSLPPGSYTAIVRGSSRNTSGVALLEVYRPTPSISLPKGVFSLGKPGAPASSTVLSNPNVDGISVRQSWSAINPSDGTFNWSFFDSEISRAAAAGKKVILRILDGGANIPSFVLAGATTKYTYTFGVGPTAGTVITIPVYWDSYFLQKKKALIDAFGARYAKNPAVVVACVGIANSHDADWHVPHDTTVDPAVGISQVQEWKNKGYTTQKLIDSCDTIIDEMMTVFPGKCVYIAINPVSSLLDPSDNYSAQTVISNERAKWGNRLIVGKNNLCVPPKMPAAPPPANSSYAVWYNAAPTVAAQMLWYCYGDSTYRNNDGVAVDPATCLQNAIDAGIGYGVKYIEIYQTDVINLPSTISYAHTKL